LEESIKIINSKILDIEKHDKKSKHIDNGQDEIINMRIE
jgi:hypothetical protein